MNEELNFINQLSSSLEGFKSTGKNVFNFRCPICGDSAKKKNKKRGYLYQKNGKFWYCCHNCNVSKSFKNFLKEQNQLLYEEFIRSTLFNEDNKKEENNQITNRFKVKTNILEKLPKISSLKSNNPAKIFIVQRQIPNNYHRTLFLCYKFKKFVNYIIPNKFNDLENDEPRIIIPIYKNKELIGFQGRSFLPSLVKYITIVLDEAQKPLLFGFDEVDWNSRHFVLEGPFDSMYIPNSVAVCGSSLLSSVRQLNKPKNLTTLVFDNEPRNKDIVSSMKKSIEEGYRICIWPDNIKEKDINEMILSKVPNNEYVHHDLIKKIGWDIRITIEENTFYGLQAELRLAEWKRI